MNEILPWLRYNIKVLLAKHRYKWMYCVMDAEYEEQFRSELQLEDFLPFYCSSTTKPHGNAQVHMVVTYRGDDKDWMEMRFFYGWPYDKARKFPLHSIDEVIRCLLSFVVSNLNSECCKREWFSCCSVHGKHLPFTSRLHSKIVKQMMDEFSNSYVYGIRGGKDNWWCYAGNTEKRHYPDDFVITVKEMNQMHTYTEGQQLCYPARIMFCKPRGCGWICHEWDVPFGCCILTLDSDLCRMC